MKYLLLLALCGVIWWVWKKRGQTHVEENRVRRDRQPEKMLICAHCGVHFPESDACGESGRFYCSEEHRQMASR